MKFELTNYNGNHFRVVTKESPKEEGLFCEVYTCTGEKINTYSANQLTYEDSYSSYFKITPKDCDCKDINAVEKWVKKKFQNKEWFTKNVYVDTPKIKKKQVNPTQELLNKYYGFDPDRYPVGDALEILKDLADKLAEELEKYLK